MGYVFGNEYGVLTVNDEKTLNEPKNIRFIRPDYSPLFTIPDNEFVQIRYCDGAVKAYQCKYLDEYHFATSDGRGWHICEFAETMERIGATCSECPEKHVIWSDRDLNLDDWRQDLTEEYPELDEDGLYEKMVEINAEYLGDEKMNLNQPIGGTMLVIADLGLWDGRRSGYREIRDAKLSDCLDYRYDSAEWYVTRDGELCGTQAHHDGTNYYVYRKVKDDVTEDALADLELMLYNGDATQADIDRVTEKLGGQVAQVYGYDLPDVIFERKERAKGGDAR